jgi:ABC-type transport system involved in multi-copper enzyme maturation permease subunit
VVIIKTVITIGVLFFFIPMLASVMFVPVRLRRVSAFRTSSPLFSILTVVFLHLNPFAAMIANSTLALSPAAQLATLFFYWPIHCVFMLIASALLIARSVQVVRRVALRQATGQPEHIKPRHNSTSVENGQSLEQTGLVRPVTGSPVLWKELRVPMIQGGEGRNSIIGFFIAVVALFITYGVCIHQRNLDDDFTHTSYVVMFVIIGSIFNMVLSATCITSEKESRAWPILLATSMDDLYILVGKAVGVFRRCSPVWILLTAHVIVFVVVGYIHPIAIVHVFLIVSGLIVFLTGVGIYFSSCFQRTTSAVVANFGFILIIWFVIPVLLGFVSEFFRRNETLYTALGVCVSANPAAQATIVMNGDGGVSNAGTKLSSLDYSWPHSKRGMGVWQTTRNLLITASIYTVIGLLFAWRAMCRFRRNIF